MAGQEEEIVLALRLKSSANISEIAELDSNLGNVNQKLRTLKKQGKETSDQFKEYKTVQLAIREEKKRLGAEIRKQVKDWQKYWIRS